jgi:ABC-type phosphate transport system auxiliary subunit
MKKRMTRLRRAGLRAACVFVRIEVKKILGIGGRAWDRMKRIRAITDEMRQLQEQKNEALRMKLRREVDAKTFREVTAEIDAAHDQLAREHKQLASEAAMPEVPDPSLAWKDLSSEDRRSLTDADRQDRHLSAPERDGRSRKAPLHNPRHPIPRSRARG